MTDPLVMRELRQRGLKLGTTAPWQQRRWRQLGRETRQHLYYLALQGSLLTYLSVTNDLGITAKAAQDLKRYFAEGGQYTTEDE